MQQSGSKRFDLDSIVQYYVCLKTLTASNYFVMGRIGQDRRQKLRIPLGLQISLILQGFPQYFQDPCNKCATGEPASFLGLNTLM